MTEPQQAAPAVAPAAAPAAPQTQREDISSKTIAILVLLALVVSFIGAWVNIQQAMQLGDAPAPVRQANVASAQVGFVVTGKPVPMSTAATGKVTLGISPAP